MIEVFIDRLRSLPEPETARRWQAAKADAGVLVRSAYDLAPAGRTTIEAAIRERVGTSTVVRFETAPKLVCGLELSLDGVKLAWSVSDYLSTLAQDGAASQQRNRQHRLQRRRRRRRRWNPPMPADTLLSDLDLTFGSLRRAREAFVPRLSPREIGTITSVSTGIATVSGLRGVGFEELIQFPGGLSGIAFNLDEDEIGVVLLGDYAHLQAGDEVTRTGRVMDVGVGEALLGRVIDPLGRPLDDLGPPAFAAAPAHRARSQDRSWIAPRSPYRCRPGSRSSTRWFRSGAVSGS